MNTAQSSFEFHLRLEHPLAFLRREWKAIAFFGGLYIALMLSVVFLIDPAFLYPRLQTDPLNYWLKAKSLVETGTTSARWAVNLPPFSYAAAPGVLRAPALLLFHDFDSQLRAIQVVNVGIVALVAALSAYVLSWTQPERRHWMVIAFAFAFTLFTPVWMANVILPLVDAPYAAVTLLAVLVSLDAICGERRPTHRPLAVALYALLFTIAFVLRFTAPVLLVYAAVLARGRWRPGAIPRRITALAIVAAVVAVGLLVAFNADAIFGRYFREPIAFLVRGEKFGMILNLLGAAIPAGVVPNFLQGFAHPPVVETYRTTFFTSPADLAWLAVGLSICGVVLCGMWTSRSRLLPEILYFLAPLPVLGLMMPSTTRYLRSYQPFIWIFFSFGVAFLYERYGRRAPRFFRTRGFALAALASAALLVGGLRAWRLLGTSSDRKLTVSALSAPRYVTDVAYTFRGLRSFLETLPRERTLLISDRGSTGRWKAIADRDYYAPDSALPAVTRDKDVYLLVECGTLESCESWESYRESLEKRVEMYGSFRFEQVYAASRPRARAEVYRMTAVE